jgi:chromosome segregation ATPase
MALAAGALFLPLLTVACATPEPNSVRQARLDRRARSERAELARVERAERTVALEIADAQRDLAAARVRRDEITAERDVHARELAALLEVVAALEEDLDAAGARRALIEGELAVVRALEGELAGRAEREAALRKELAGKQAELAALESAVEASRAALAARRPALEENARALAEVLATLEKLGLAPAAGPAKPAAGADGK